MHDLAYRVRVVKISTPQDKALLFIAACERKDADRQEREIVRLSRKWISIVNSPETTQGVVDKLLLEFEDSPDDDYGSIWADLKTSVYKWASREGWLDG